MWHWPPQNAALVDMGRIPLAVESIRPDFLDLMRKTGKEEIETQGEKERYKGDLGTERLAQGKLTARSREIDSEISEIEIVRSLRCCWLRWWQVLVKLRCPCRCLATILDSILCLCSLPFVPDK